MTLSRRTLLAAAPLLFAGRSALAGSMGGIPIGIQTYSFRSFMETPGDMVDKIIAAMTECGLDQCELWEPEIAPKDRAQWPSWRLETPIEHFQEIRARFAKAGIRIFAFNFGLVDDLSDAEIDRGFQITKALGTEIMTASSTLTMAKRTVPFAERHQVIVAMHGHSDLRDPNQFAAPQSFEAAMAMSPLYRINLDIGHFAAAGFDPVAFIRMHYNKITNLHIKDRKKDDGSNMPFGQGDTPIKAVLRLLKQENWRIPAFVEYEYDGTGTPVEEVRKCLDYMRAILA